MSRYRDRGERNQPTATLYVRNISDRTRYEDLKHLFQKYGRLVDVTIPLDFYSRLPKGYCFVEYEDVRDAEEAQYRLDRQRLFGREVEIEFAKGARKTPDEMKVRRVNSSDNDNYRDHRDNRRDNRDYGRYGNRDNRDTRDYRDYRHGHGRQYDTRGVASNGYSNGTNGSSLNIRRSRSRSRNGRDAIPENPRVERERGGERERERERFPERERRPDQVPSSKIRNKSISRSRSRESFSNNERRSHSPRNNLKSVSRERSNSPMNRSRSRSHQSSPRSIRSQKMNTTNSRSRTHSRSRSQSPV